nr:hypothetical protein [Tanacetum cinerariifolium]
MSSLFADTHNVVAILEKSDAAEGFKQIINFLSGSYIHYALTVSPRIYISCIKQFWNSVSVKRSGDVTRLQALVDKKKIMISEDVIREILQLNDAKGVICLPNEEIFAGLAQIGYEKPSTKLTFYKAFFSSQWKFLIHNILQPLSTKRTSWNEFSTAMASVVICLSKGQRFNFSKYIFDSLVRNVDSSSKFYMYPRFIQLIIQAQVGDLSTHTTRFIFPALTQKVFANMRRVRKGFSGVETPLFEIEDVIEDVAEDVAHVATPSPPSHGIPSPPQEPSSPPQQPHRLEIVKLKAKVKKLEKTDKIKSLKLRRLRKVGESRQVESSDDMEDEVVEVVTTAKIITEVVTAAASQVSAASTTIPVASVTIPAANPTIFVAAPTVDKGKGIMIEAPKPMKNKDQFKMDAEYARKLQEEIDRDHDRFNKDVDWDAAMDHVNQKSSSNPQYIKRYQGMKKRPQTESEARKNMMIYLKNTTGYKMDFFKGMTYAQICPIFQARFDENIRFLFKSREEMEAKDQKIIKSINETPAQKAAKRRKLSEEAQESKDLRKRLEVVEDEDDDVFVEATPLASKVPVVDYQIVLIGNKPREDLETLWRIVKDRFSTSKPTNFLDEYLLLTLKTLFEEPDRQDAIWRNQKSVHGLALVKRWKLLTSCDVHVITLSTVQLFLLVERSYLLSRFTLEQLVNVARLQVEEESEMSLELLRFTRQQLQEYQQG